MTVAIVQIVVLLALVLILFVRERDHANALGQAFDLAAHERSADAEDRRREHEAHLAALMELVNKVQHPQIYRPAPDRPQEPIPAPPEPDGFDLAGREVVLDEDFARLQDAFDEHIDMGEPVTP